MAVIQTQALTKRYGESLGIQDVNLSVKEGEIFGFLGPNGAGKTTTIRLLLDLMNPTSGQVRLFGQTVNRKDRTLFSQVGYLPGELRMHEHMTGQQTLGYLGRFQNTQGPVRRRELLAALDLAPTKLKQPLRTYSQGMKRKIGIVQAMQHDPRLLILDEPTDGLDPLMKQSFYHLLRDYRERGGTVFMSSHILPEVETICDRVALIREGSIVAVEEVADLQRRHTRRLRLVTETPLDASRLLQPGVTVKRQEGTTTILLVSALVRIPALLATLARLDILDMTFEDAKLEDFFMQYYEEDYCA
jgi:ABC-2 type transport system ATP-binding protein